MSCNNSVIIYIFLWFFFIKIRLITGLQKSTTLDVMRNVFVNPSLSKTSNDKTNEKYIALPDTREPLENFDIIDRQNSNYQKPGLQYYDRRWINGPRRPVGVWASDPRTNYGADFDQDDYRTAPVNEDPGAEPYVITEDRLKRIRKDLLYWFFDKGGSDGNGDYQKNIHDSSPQIHKNFNFQLPFFGFRFNYTRVSMNGYLEFSDPPEHYTYPVKFPNRDWPKKNDPSFIGIFFSKCRIGMVRRTDQDQRKAGLYFRLERDLHRRRDRLGVEVRERVKWDLREGVVGTDTFYPKHVAIITWKNMSFGGGIDNSLYKTNTFQIVLATDEVFTYAIFNYASITWTTHTEAGGDTTGGEGGIPAFVGFNAGNGTRSFEYKPYSQASTIRDLTSRGWANGLPGRHIFRIDENILLGTCNKDIAGANLQLSFAPESGNMLGGTVVNITGPCFNESMKVRCRFDVESVVGTVVDRNRAICVQPFLMAEGYVLFDIAIGDGAYNWKGKYFVETPATAAQKIFFESKAIHERFPPEIAMTWDVYNLTNSSNAPIQISLWGYKETTIRPQLMYIDLLEDSINNVGRYKIIPSFYQSRNNERVNDLRVGFIQINLTNPVQFGDLTVSPVLWSRPIPLGWYFSPQWGRKYGSKWADKMCDDWIMNDRYLKNFAAEIPQCPCTLEQALIDKGRFMPDYDCDRDSNPDCDYHKGAIQCVRSGAPSLEGSEQQCCYDKNHYLMLSYDQQWGSRPRRSHNLGYIPWNEANKVPTLSQWFHDISPFYFCCLWQEEQAVGCETFRFERRPSQDCVAYQPPYVATVFGDPHVITFDNLAYTFNGKGEFVLVHADSEKFKFDVQGRFEQLSDNADGPVRATQLTSVAARDNTSAIIEVRIRPPYAQWRYRLDVFANEKRIYFDRPALRTQHFPGVTVYTPLYILNQSEVIIMFESGAGVQVIENEGYMTARVYLPWQFINQTKGLLGTWNFDLSDDFTTPDGSVSYIPSVNNFQTIHQTFAIKWLLEDKVKKNLGSPLFVREYGRTASYYANETFQPEWQSTPEDILTPKNRTKDIQIAYALCGESYQCQYDYSVSLNRDLAFYTLQYLSSFTSIQAKTKERVITCGVLETPRFGRKSNFLFVPGTKVTFECNQGFILVGDQRRTCTSSGRWDIPEHGYTECLREEEYDMRAIGSTFLVILLILLPLLLLVFCIGGHVLRRIRKNGSPPSWNYTTNSRRASLLRLDSAGLAAPLKSNKNETERHVLSGASSPTSSVPSDNRIPLVYDGVYFTHEPLANKPMVEFEPKVWDITEDDVFSSQSKLSSPSSVTQNAHSKNIEQLYSKPNKFKKQNTSPPQGRNNSHDYLEPVKRRPGSQSVETDIF